MKNIASTNGKMNEVTVTTSKCLTALTIDLKSCDRLLQNIWTEVSVAYA